MDNMSKMEDMYEEEDFSFDIQKFISILKLLMKKWPLIVGVTLSFTILTAMYSIFLISPSYKSDIAVLIDNSNEHRNETVQNYNEIMMYQQLAKTYSEFTKKRVVLDDVIKELGLNRSVVELQEMVSTTIQSDTNFLTISVSSDNKEEAQSIANQLAKSLKKITFEIQGVDNVKLVDEALLPEVPVNSKPIMNSAKAFLLGLVLSVCIIFLIEYFDNTVKDADITERFLGLPVYGEISWIDEKEMR